MHPFLERICTNKTRKQYNKDGLETQKREDPTEREVMEILRIMEKGRIPGSQLGTRLVGTSLF